MVNIATCIISYLNIITIAETQQCHISEKFTFNECPRHLSNFVMWGKAHPWVLTHKMKFDDFGVSS